MPAPTLKPLPPEEAIRYFRAKGLETSYAWQDLWKHDHARAFTVAKAMDREVLQTIREGIDQAIAEGKTLEQFIAELTPLLQAQGWWGKKEMTDPLTGETRTVQLGSPRRLTRIYETNLRVAYAAGRWERFQRTKAAFPYLRYNHTPQEHPRLEHLAWGEEPVILPIDDPWWDAHYPPNGWNCKCFVTQTSERLMSARGEKLSPHPVRFPPKAYTNPRTGEVTRVEGGIDPGWDYNPGKAPLEGVTPTPSPQTPAEAARPADGGAPAGLAPTTELPIGASAAPELLAEDVTAAEAEAAFLGAFGLAPDEYAVVNDLVGAPIAIGPGLFRDGAGAPFAFSAEQLRVLPLVAETLKNPAEILWAWRDVQGGKSQLVRRYIARLRPAGRILPIDVVVDMAVGGASPSWSFSTSLEAGFDLVALRTAAVVWRRADPGGA